MLRHDAIEQLRSVVEHEQPRIVRMWAKLLRAETHEIEILGADLREPLTGMMAQLERLLRTRGEDAIRLWPEAVRSLGARRYRQHFDAGDLAREFKVLHKVLLRVHSRRYLLEPEVAELIAELVGEATACAQASFARVLRTEEVRFHEAAVMETVLHHLEAGIWVAQPDGTLSFATPPLAKLLGVPVRSLVGASALRLLPQLLTELDARHLDGSPFRVTEMPLIRALKEKLPVRDILMRIHRRDAREVVLELSATPIWDDAAVLAGVIQTFTDRSEETRKSAELNTARDALTLLENRVQHQTRTQALGQLASGTAHALNNFLNVLRLRITLLRRDSKPEHLAALDRTVDSIGELVARLQDFSNTRSGDELVAVPFGEVVRETIALARAELEGPEAPLTLELGEVSTPGCVRVDVGFFRELLANLLLAERERMPEGGTLQISTHRDGDTLTLELADSGERYSEEDLIHLFEPLKTRSKQPQVSLMLGVARNQARRWGGTLECHNRTDGQGAVYCLRLPLAQQEHAEDHASRPSNRLSRPPARRVLVVDDDPDNGRMLAEVLGEEGYGVQVAYSGDDALKLWSTQSFDAALLDAVMPDMSGWELARELRRRSPTVLLGMVTGLDVRGQNRANLAVLDAVFRKPIDVSALDDFLSRAPARNEAPGGQGLNETAPIR